MRTNFLCFMNFPISFSKILLLIKKDRPQAGVLHCDPGDSHDSDFFSSDGQLHCFPGAEDHQWQPHAIRLPTPFHHS